MKYKVTYILQKEVSVIVDIKDKELNREFKRLGEIHSDSDFNGVSDPRWKIEEKGYDKKLDKINKKECKMRKNMVL